MLVPQFPLQETCPTDAGGELRPKQTLPVAQSSAVQPSGLHEAEYVTFSYLELAASVHSPVPGTWRLALQLGLRRPRFFPRTMSALLVGFMRLGFVVSFHPTDYFDQRMDLSRDGLWSAACSNYLLGPAGRR